MAVAAVDELVSAASEAAFGACLARGEPGEEGGDVEISAAFVSGSGSDWVQGRGKDLIMVS